MLHDIFANLYTQNGLRKDQCAGNISCLTCLMYQTPRRCRKISVPPGWPKGHAMPHFPGSQLFGVSFWGLLSCLNMSAVHHSNHSLWAAALFSSSDRLSSNSLTARKDSQDIPTLGSRDWIEGKFREPWVFLHPMIAFRCSFQPKN